MRGTINRTVVFTLISTVLFISGCAKSEELSLWHRKCEACHDGKTILNEKVVINKEQLKAKYASLDAFVNACNGSPSCMNILKHDKDLLREVGREIGIEDTSR